MCMDDSALVEAVLPEGWPRPRGYSQGLRIPAGHDLVVVAGQVGWDQNERFVGHSFVEQFEQALSNCVRIVEAAGGRAEHIVRLTMYCRDRHEYLYGLKDVGAAYRRVMGQHYPVMALVEVRALVEDAALIEIEATAALPPGSPPPLRAAAPARGGE